jgi:hypothetical protein
VGNQGERRSERAAQADQAAAFGPRPCRPGQDAKPLARAAARPQSSGPGGLRFWQEGPGFDRNLFPVKAVQASIGCIHNNPVARGLWKTARDWRWLNVRFYESDRTILDPLHPRITHLSAEFWHGP